MKKLTHLLLALPAFAAAQLSTSPTYTLLHSTTPGGPVQNAAGTVVANIEAGSPVAGGAAQAAAIHSLANHTGRLYDPVALNLTTDPDQLPEFTKQLIDPELVMDDATTLLVPATEIVWQITAGPLTQIDPNGLVYAGHVYRDTPAELTGTIGSLIGTLPLTVINTGADDFGSYAGDGLDDNWQFTHFGLDNPDAAPDRDPDADSQNNEFENLAGSLPTDPLSLFTVSLAFPPEQPTHREIIFSPVLPDRTYTVNSAPVPDPSQFLPLTSPSTSDDGGERTVTDTDAAGPLKFYHVDITRQ